MSENNQQEIFEFLKKNLSVDVNCDETSNYGNDRKEIDIKIYLKNPKTEKAEVIASGSSSI